MGIKKIVLEPANGLLNGHFDGEECVILVNNERTFQVLDPDSSMIVTVSTQILPIVNPVTHNGYLVSQDILKVEFPEELRLSDKTGEK